MTREITLTDSVASALSAEKRDGETYSNTVERLLGGTDSEELSETEQLAQNAMNVTELQAAHSKEMSNAEYLAHTYGIDVDKYGSAESLRAAKAEANQ